MDNKLPQGLNFQRPNEKAPEFVKGKLGLNIGRLLKWIEENNVSGEWINFDLLQSKDGTKLYFKLNDWKATSTPNQTAPVKPQNDADREFEGLDDPSIINA